MRWIPLTAGPRKYSELKVVGMGGEYVRLISDALADQPAARKAGLFRTDELTLIRRSPMPSLMLDRYEVRRYQIAKLIQHN